MDIKEKKSDCHFTASSSALCHSTASEARSENPKILNSSLLDSPIKSGNDRGEKGRSMTEMLGVLAIIGVLSIGGIAGYSYAMDKYRANTIMNDVNLRAVDLIAQASRGNDLSLDEWPTKTIGKYDIGLEIDAETNTTEGGVYVDKVPQSICEILADDLLPSRVLLAINGEDYVSGNCGETNKMVFYYDDVSSSVVKKEDLENCQGEVIDGVCMPCPENTTWSEEQKVCLCSDGTQVWDFDTSACLTGCAEAFHNVFQVGDTKGSWVTVQGTTATLDIPPDGTQITLTMIADANASHCTLNIAGGQNASIGMNGHELKVRKLSIGGSLEITDWGEEVGLIANSIDLSDGGVMTMNFSKINVSTISLSNSVINMYGDVINGNISLSGSSVLNMAGGEVNGNISLSDSTQMNMSGGLIEASSLTLSNASGVYMSDGTLRMDNVTISDTAILSFTGGTVDVGTLKCSDTSGGVEGWWAEEYFMVDNMACSKIENYWSE